MGMKVNGTSGLTFPDTTTLASAGQASVRAWVNFDGTGTVAIRASYNVTSITDGGVGVYRVNFTAAMPDTNYAVTASSSFLTPTDWPVLGSPDNFTVGASKLTTSVSIATGYRVNGTYGDAADISVSIFR